LLKWPQTFVELETSGGMESPELPSLTAAFGESFMYVSVALQTFAVANAPLRAAVNHNTPPPPPSPVHLSRVLQASEILRRIETFFNNDNDPDADTFLLYYGGHGMSKTGNWSCDKSLVTFENVVDLWEVCSHGRFA
jgi:hypothetical protein